MTRPRGGSTARVVAAVGALTMVGKVAGFGRELLLARYFGATRDIDALLLAMTPGSAVVLLVGESLRYSVIPELSAAEASRGLRGFWSRARAITTDVAWFGLVLSVALGLGAKGWIAVIAGGAPAETQAVAVHLAPILAPMVFAALGGNVLSAIHNARGHVVRAAAAELSCNVVTIPVLLLFAAAAGIAAAAWGWVGGYLGYLALLAVPFLGRRLPRQRGDAGSRRGFHGSNLLLAIAASTIPVINVIDRAVASGLPEGSIAALNYAFKVVLLPISIVVSALGSVSFPELARRLAMGESAAAAARLRGDLLVYVAVVAPVVLLIPVLALPLTRVLFERGAFGPDASVLTAFCLSAYAGSIAFHGIVLLLIRGAMAGGWIHVPVTGAIACVAINAVLDVVLARLLGAPGIALAFTIASGANALVTGALLRRRLRGSLPSLGLLVRVLAAAAPAAAAARFFPVSFSSPLADLLCRGTVAVLVLGALYQVLGVFRACASSWGDWAQQGKAAS